MGGSARARIGRSGFVLTRRSCCRSRQAAAWLKKRVIGTRERRNLSRVRRIRVNGGLDHCEGVGVSPCSQ